MHDRSLAEPALRASLLYIINHGEPDVVQLARLCLDLVLLAGAVPAVKQYIDQQAISVLEDDE